MEWLLPWVPALLGSIAQRFGLAGGWAVVWAASFLFSATYTARIIPATCQP